MSSRRREGRRVSLKFQFRPLAIILSVANRTNNSHGISSDKGIRGNVLGDYRTRPDERVLAYCYAADDGRASSDPQAFLNHDGLSDCGGASLGRFKGMARRDDAHV